MSMVKKSGHPVDLLSTRSSDPYVVSTTASSCHGLPARSRGEASSLAGGALALALSLTFLLAVVRHTLYVRWTHRD